ncbi:MAG: hypothetical protein WC375_03645 [Methanomassiliicoccales archaeon]
MSASASALSRDIIENELIIAHHWLPQDIAKIPYKKLQRMFVINKYRNEFSQQKVNIEKFKQEMKSTGSGQAKRFREV